MPKRAAIVATLILERPMCEACISTKSGLGAADLDATLASIRTSLRLYSAIDRCRACGALTTVLSVDRPA